MPPFKLYVGGQDLEAVSRKLDADPRIEVIGPFQNVRRNDVDQHLTGDRIVVSVDADDAVTARNLVHELVPGRSVTAFPKT